MADEPFHQAETALAELAGQFEDWRRSRTTGQERIPPSLWDRAVALSTVLPCSCVARRLRVRSTDLRKRALVKPSPATTEETAPIPAFIEVPVPVPVPWPGPATSGITLIEVERPDGTRLRVRYRDAPPLATVLRAFLEPA